MPATVVVVTPDAALRATAEQVIGAAGYRVLTAPHTGHALLACLKAGSVDVLVVDRPDRRHGARLRVRRCRN